jgi:hypothetical protein
LVTERTGPLFEVSTIQGKEVVMSPHVKVKAARCTHGTPEVFIFIGSNADNNTIYADDQEQVDKHSQVTFFAGSPCTLYFKTNNPVFPQDKYPLTKGSNPLKPSGSGSTPYSINTPPPPIETGPILVVP